MVSVFQDITISYWDGEFFSASLFVATMVNGANAGNYLVTLKDKRQALDALRSIEKIAGKVAELKESTIYDREGEHRIFRKNVYSLTKGQA